MQRGGRPAWATVADFVKLSGIGRTKVFELLAARALAGRKLGARTLIEVDSGLAYIDSLPVWGGESIAAEPGALSVRAALEPVNASMLGEPINYNRLLRAARAGEIPAECRGTRWFIRRADLPAVAAHFLKRNGGRAMRRAMKGAA